MAETVIHVIAIVYLIGMLRAFFHRRGETYVVGDIFVYYQEGDPAQRVAPDVFVAFGVPTHERRSWFIWQEGKSPDVIFEITSRGTRAEDQGVKKGLYEWLGVKEYFLFDPLGDYLQPRLQGFRWVDGSYK
ncbi:MAG: Uma2 family endonuclease, partial [Chloroflexi bacterium]|nr:Uma2 family endonuclease [Chloroflexota bacterium]